MSDGEVNELIATLERSNLRRTAAVFKSRFDALTAENERLRQRLLTAAGDDLCRLTQEEIKDLAGGKVPIPPKAEFLASCERFHSQIAGENGVDQNCLTLAQLVAENERLTRELEEAKDMLANWVTSCVYCGEEWTCSEDTYESSCAEHDKICEKHPLREVERELAAAQQRLAALAVDPADKVKLGEMVREGFNERGAKIELGPMPDWHTKAYQHIGAKLFAAGRLSRDPEVAELKRQLAEARKWEGQYKRLYENCDASHEKTLKQLAEATKRLAELTKPADEIELRKVAWANYGAIYAQQKGEPLEPYESSTPERRARIDKAANAVAACVRGPLVQQIAELNEKMEAAHERIKGQCEQIGNHGRCITRQRETIKRFKADRDRLAAELATAKQALAAARGDVERLRNPVAIAVSEAIDEGLARGPSPSPANPAASQPVGLCPKCGIQPLTKEGDDMIRLGEKDYLCGNCKRYLCRPIESKAAASEPADSSHTPETAHTSSSQSETAERRFVCPECGGTETIETGSTGGDVVRCKKCRYRCTWAEVEAAKGEETKDNRRLGHRQIDDLRARAFCCESDVNDALALLNDRDAILVELQVMKQQLAAATQAREAEKQRADDTQVRLEAFERSPDEKQKSIWELEEAVSEAEERANENARLLHEQRQRASAAEGREAALQSKVNDLEASRTVLKRDAESAETAAGVMLETLKAAEYQLLKFGSGFWECNCRDLAQDGRVCNKHELAARITRTIKTAADPGRAANDLRAGKALAGKIRDALCSVEAIAHIERALADYDQALSQGEQRGEGQHGR